MEALQELVKLTIWILRCTLASKETYYSVKRVHGSAPRTCKVVYLDPWQHISNTLATHSQHYVHGSAPRTCKVVYPDPPVSRGRQRDLPKNKFSKKNLKNKNLKKKSLPRLPRLPKTWTNLKTWTNSQKSASWCTYFINLLKKPLWVYNDNKSKKMQKFSKVSALVHLLYTLTAFLDFFFWGEKWEFT